MLREILLMSNGLSVVIPREFYGPRRRMVEGAIQLADMNSYFGGGNKIQILIN